jgi:hypothetical protein
MGGGGLPGEICYRNNCLPVSFLTTRWTVDQVQQVLNLFYAGYSPYKISRVVHRRTVDVYQIVYHRSEVQQVIGFLTTPHGVVRCGNVEESVLYISTTWNCNQLIEAYVLLSEGYSAYSVARKLHKRTADVVAIRNHMDYFQQVITDIYKKKPGILRYGQYEVNFALPGEYDVNQVCQMLRNGDPLLTLWLTSDDEDAKYYLMVVYIVNGVYSIDLFRGCVLTLDLATLIAVVVESTLPVAVGVMKIEPNECILKYDFCDFEYIINSIMSSYYNTITAGLGRANEIG